MRAQQAPGAQLQSLGLALGPAAAPARGDPPAPGAHFACPAKLLMSRNGDFLTVAQACHLGPASSLLKGPEHFLAYDLL